MKNKNYEQDRVGKYLISNPGFHDAATQGWVAQWDANEALMGLKIEKNTGAGKPGQEFNLYGGQVELTSKGLFVAVMDLNPASRRKLDERVARQLRNIMGEEGYMTISPRHGDAKSHIVLLHGDMSHLSEEERARAVEEVQQNRRVKRVMNELKGGAFYLNRVVSSGRDVIASSGNPIPSINWARDELTPVLEGVGIVPVFYGDIIHTTQNRKVEGSQIISEGHFRKIIALDNKVQANPVPVEIASVSLDSNYGYVKRTHFFGRKPE